MSTHQASALGFKPNPGILTEQDLVKPRVLYVGPLDFPSTTSMRLELLREMGVSVFPWDSAHFFRKIPAWKRPLFFSRPYRRANQALRRAAQESFDLIWVEKGFWIWPSTLKRLKRTGAFLIHHTTDALRPRYWKYRRLYQLMRKTLSLYDLFFTSNVGDFRALSGRAATRVELTQLAYNPFLFHPARDPDEIRKIWQSDLLFVGHHEPRTESYIAALVQAGLNVKVFGDGWEKARHRKALKDSLGLRRLTNQEYVWAIKGTKIGLCFVSEWNQNQTSDRSFEVPACGTFLLAVRTPQHQECYQEGREAEFFSNEKELVQKAAYYLAHEEKRREIAQKGHERCLRSDYSWRAVMQRDWEKITDRFSAFQRASPPRAEPIQDFRIRDLLLEEQMSFDSDDVVLEIGVGSGFTAMESAKKVRRVTGLDISPPLIRKLKKLNSRRKYPNLFFVAADATQSQAGKRFEGEFSKVFSCDTLEHVKEPAALFRVIHQVLKPGGQALITFPNERPERAHGNISFTHLDQIRQMIEMAGFRNYEIVSVQLNPCASFLAHFFVKFPLGIFRRFRSHEPRGRPPHTFDETWFFRNSDQWQDLAWAINFYWKWVLGVISLKRPVYLCKPIDNRQILDRQILINAYKEKA